MAPTPESQTLSTRHLLRRELYQGPITALAFFRSAYVLAGEDTHLGAYEVATGRFLGRVRIFKSQSIHGIRVQNKRAFLWGASSVASISEDALDTLVGGGQAAEAQELDVCHIRAPDWIYDVAPSPFDANCVALATAHNEVVTVRFDASPAGIAPVLGPLISPSRPILCAANMCWLDDDCVLVAGGTIFGEILVWKCHLSERQPEMLAVLTGHEGSIFGVNLSDEFICADGSIKRFLASCSDDRTIRIWDVTERQAADGQEKSNHLSLQQELATMRETGFGSSPGAEKSTDDGEKEDRAVAVAMGHISRIWGVLIAPVSRGQTLSSHGLSIYSFGEDATTQRWQLELDLPLSASDPKTASQKVSGSLTHKETFAAHDGKHLWGRAVLNNEGETLIVTGGADSKITLIRQPILPDSGAITAEQSPQNMVALDVPSILATLLNPSQPSGRELFSRYDFPTDDEVLATTSQGRLLHGKFGSHLTWEEIDADTETRTELRQSYVLRRIGKGAVLFGSKNGRIYHYTTATGIAQVATVPGRIVNIFLLGDCHSGDDRKMVDILVDLHGVSDAHYLSLDATTGHVQESVELKCLDNRFVALSAAKIGNGLIAVGSRHGFLTLLTRDGGDFKKVLENVRPTTDAITGIIPLPAKEAATRDGCMCFMTTSRDGKCRIYEIEQVDSLVVLHLRHERASVFGNVIEGGWVTEGPCPELVLYGFKSMHFMLWNETRHELLAAINCGGAHREFTLMHSASEAGRIRFAYTKTSQLFIYSQQRPTMRTLREGTHGREIRTLSWNGRLLASGAEDTVIKLWEYRHKDERQDGTRMPELTCVASIKAHVSGLMRIVWVGEDYMLSSAGREELFVWRVSRLNTLVGVGVLCEAVFQDKSRDADLRILNFDACKAEAGEGILLTMVLSNSTVKTYRYTQDEGFRLLAQMTYTGASLTQVRQLGVHDNGVSVLTASTDGHLATWEARFDSEAKATVSHVLVQVVPVHQNCIKGLDLRATDGGFLVVTGGDDNGLGVSRLTALPGDGNLQRYAVSKRCIVRRAHAAALNEVVLVQRGDDTLVLSVSNDQRVKLWQVNSGGTSLKLLRDEYSGVADPADVEILARDDRRGGSDEIKLVIGGVGAEVWAV